MSNRPIVEKCRTTYKRNIRVVTILLFIRLLADVARDEFLGTTHLVIGAIFPLAFPLAIRVATGPGNKPK